MELIPNSLQNVSKQTFLELLYSCVDDICERKVQHDYSNFKSCTNWTKIEYDTLNINLKRLICSVLEDSNPESKILELCPGLSPDHLCCILDCLSVCKCDIKTTFLKKSFSVSGSKLHDFDWKLKWIIGSSTLSSLREPLLSLDFNLCEGCDVKSFSVELNENELKTLLTALEKAQDCVRKCQN